MSRPILTTAPAEAPVTLAEAKANLRVDGSDEDTLISALIEAATSHLDGWTGVLGRCMVTQTWAVGLRAWPSCIRLPFPDVSGAAITYYDENAVEQTVSGSLYEVTHGPLGSVVEFKEAWTRPTLYDDMAEPISVAVTAGYGDGAAVPQALKQAIILLVGQHYETRVSATEATFNEVPLAFHALIAPYRFVGV